MQFVSPRPLQVIARHIRAPGTLYCSLMMKTSFVLRSVLLLLVVGVGAVCGEVFTALVHMEGLLELEGELLASLNSYITAERQRLAACKYVRDVVLQ